MKTKRAIFCVVPDARQQWFLSRVFPSWERYGRRHNLDLIIVRRSITNGRHPYWDRWLSIQPGQPEVDGFDELVMLDNDIFITKDAPNIFESWTSDKIGVAEESAQGPWDPATIPAYYRGFHADPDSRLPKPTKVFNFGVTVINRCNAYLFKELFEKWLTNIRPRFTADELQQADIFFRLEADGPFLSYEIQTKNMVSPLAGEFNFFLLPALKRMKVSHLFFLLQSKFAQRASGKVPRFLLNLATFSARDAIRNAINQCYFLHVAASKSPLWLLPS